VNASPPGVDASPIAMPTGAPAEGVDLVGAAVRYDLAATERVIDELFGRGSFEAVIDDLVLPAAANLGEAWAGGRLDVAAEHLASGALMRRLSTLLDQGGAPGSGAPVLVGLPPSSWHQLGALAFAVALRRQGIDVLYLGPDVPAESWVDAVEQSAARAAVIGVVTDSDVAPAGEVAERIQAARPELVIAVGGASAARVSGPGVTVLPARVMDAVRVIRERISLLA